MTSKSRRILFSTNAIESLNARYRRAVRARGHPPERASSAQMPIPGHPVAGPDRAWAGTMDHAMEASTERVRDRLRGPLAHRRAVLTNKGQKHRNSDTPEAMGVRQVCGVLGEVSGQRMWFASGLVDVRRTGSRPVMVNELRRGTAGVGAGLGEEAAMSTRFRSIRPWIEMDRVTAWSRAAVRGAVAGARHTDDGARHPWLRY